MKPSWRYAVTSLVLLLPSMSFTDVSGGFIESADRAAVRAPWTSAQIEAFLPARGRFTFPAPYGTEGIRLTNATDCGGVDCVLPVGSSYGRNTNNHRGRDAMLIFVGLRGAGPTLFSYSKSTGQVRKLGPLFEASSPLARHSGDGWYFSASLPTRLYVTGELSPALQRYDVVARTFEPVFDTTSQFGADKYIWQARSSDDDNVHSATLRDLSSHDKLGCVAYREDARQFFYYAALAEYDGCQVDESGRWLWIREDRDGLPGRENVVVDLETGEETILAEASVAGSPSGDGDLPADGNATLASVATSRPHACTIAAAAPASARASEVVCFRPDGSRDVLVVTQSMTDLGPGRPGRRRPPQGNLDVTGRYFVWVGGGHRADAFIVKVPAQLLTTGHSDDTSPAGSARPARSAALAADDASREAPTLLAAVPAGLIAHLSLDEGTGVTSADLSGNGNVGTLMNGAAWTAGTTGGGVILDGVNDYVSIPHSAALNAFPLSVTVWFKTTTTTGFRGLVNKYVGGSMNGYQIYFSNGNLCAWYMRDSANYIYDGTSCTLSTAGYNDGQWHQAAFVVDATDGRLYVDGMLKGSRPWTGTAGAPSTTQEIRLGHYPAGGSYLPATIDEFCIYERALTASEALQLYDDSRPAPGPIAYLKLDEGAGTAANDSSGNGNAGTLMNGATWTAGTSGGGIALDGVDDYVGIPHSAALNALPLSVTVWFKTTTTTGFRGLVNKYFGGSMNGYQIYFSNGNLCAWYMRDSASYIYDGTNCTLSTAGYNDGQWHHAAFVIDATDGRLYVDGMLKGSRPWTGTAGAPSTPQEIRLGHYPAGGSYLPATIDEFRIYKRALTAGEVLEIYNDGRLVDLKLDEGAGIAAGDSSGNGNAGTLMNGATWTAGTSGGGVALDGVDDYVGIPHSAALNALPLSVTVWFKTTTTTSFRGLVNKYFGGSMNGYQIYFSNGNLCAWYMRNSASYIYDGTNCTLSTAGYNDGQWHQAAFVVDATDGRLYVDGMLKGSRPWTGTAGAPSTTQEIRLGHYPAGGSYLPATIDEFRIYKRALTAGEVLQLYSGVPAADTTPPLLSGVAVTAVGATNATVAWTTNEPADSQVEYGTTTAYGSSTTLAPALVLSHSQALSGLTAATLYHYRVKSRDASGNLATSVDFAFTTLDGTPPSVSITSPAGGATVSGTINVTADASDNVAVAGVQFKRGGVNIGAEDTTSPYSVSWNTTGVANGSHTLTAVARDAAGNTTTSAGVTVTVSNDTTAPSVSITSPAGGATVSGTINVTADASDNVAVVGVQFKRGGVNIGAEDTTSPYSVSWNTTGVANGSHTLTAVARDAAGNTTTSAGVTVTVENGGTVTFSPQDTFIGLDTTNQSTDAQLRTYTWPDNQVANAILMKFDLSSILPTAVVTDATLHVALVDSDTAPESTYTVAAHKVVDKNPLITATTGYTADGVIPWTPNTCCDNNVPLAQADISAAYDTRAIDKTLGDKTWSVTAMAQEWVTNPLANFGLLLNSDATKLRDRYRTFASMEHATPSLRPYLSITYSLVPDVTPPLITAVLASGITTSAATITWTTNEPSDSQVEYGTTTTYGSLSPLNALRVTAHLQPLSGLAASTLYHYRVRSRDAAGNLALSGDSTFTTLALDSTPPTVSITAPSGGATVSGTINVAANASDNVAVAGVQFKLDGANLGAEDTSSPFSISWSSTSASNGSHSLTAVARDAAGNSATSAAVNVTVSNSGGIAALYPGDAGIEGHPDVVFTEMFEESSISNLTSRYNDVANSAGMSFTSDVPTGSGGSRSLTMNNGSVDATHLYKLFSPGYDKLYLRYYVKYSPTGDFHHTSGWLGSYNQTPWPNPQAGTRPSGNDRFSAGVEPLFDDGNKPISYTYWMGMQQSGDGNYWGNWLNYDSADSISRDQWHCVETMIQLNNPVSSANGELALWLDGVQIEHMGQGFPRGNWVNGIFTPNPSGSPFPGFQWRNTTALKIDFIWLQNFVGAAPKGVVEYDHLIAAKSYIGCLIPGAPDTTAPSVTSGVTATVASGSEIDLSWTASTDNVGVTGYKIYRCSGSSTCTPTLLTALGNVTSYPNTSLIASTLYRYQVSAIDAAGNESGRSSIVSATTSAAGSTNEPAGLTLINDHSWNCVPCNGWSYRADYGWSDIQADPAAPRSASNVLRVVFPSSMPRDNGPSNQWLGLGTPKRELYTAYWIKWGQPWDAEEQGAKVSFSYTEGGQYIYTHLGPGEPPPYDIGKVVGWPPYGYSYGDRGVWHPNVTTTPVWPGQWYFVEEYYRYPSTPGGSDGVIRWWVNGTLNGNFTNVTYPADGGFVEFQFPFTRQATPTDTSYVYIDHTRVSGKP